MFRIVIVILAPLRHFSGRPWTDPLAKKQVMYSPPASFYAVYQPVSQHICMAKKLALKLSL